MKWNTSLPAEGCTLSLVKQRIKYLSQVIYGWHSERYGRGRFQTFLVAVFSQLSNEKPRTKLQFNGFLFFFFLQIILFSLSTGIFERNSKFKLRDMMMSTVCSQIFFWDSSTEAQLIQVLWLLVFSYWEQALISRVI